MSEVLETTVGKFTFRVPTDRTYTPEGLWVLMEDGGRFARIGLSDFLQQSSGDVAFAKATPEGMAGSIVAGSHEQDLALVQIDGQHLA